jgi:DNA-binding response OmpR family regulator
MDVQSGPGQDTKIIVLLPATIGAPAETHHPATIATPGKGNGEFVLVAEDDRFVREVMATNLRTNNYQVEEADSGTAMMNLCGQHRDHLQLLIVDVDLPERNGLSCLRALRADGVDVPAIIVTGGLDTDQGDDLPQRTLVLRKPFQMSHLVGLVYTLLTEQQVKEGSAP